MSYPIRVVTGFIAFAMVFGAVAMANGDVLQTRDRLHDKTCIAADQIRDQIRLKLHDGTCV